MSFDLPGGIGLELARGGVAGVPWWLLSLSAAALLVLLYRAERRLVSRRAGAALLVLRLLAAGLLASFLAEPTLSWTGRVAMPGRVIVAVDVSDSMDTADPLPRREVVARLLDDAGSPLMRLARDHALEFRSFARTTSPATAAGLAGSLGKPGRGDDPLRGATDWRPVLAEAAQASSKRAAMVKGHFEPPHPTLPHEGGGLRIIPSPLVGEGQGGGMNATELDTNRGRPLSGEGVVPPVTAVLLVTDGKFNPSRSPGESPAGQDDEATLLEQLKAAGIPVYSLMVGSTAPPSDLAVAEVRAPEAVFQGDVAPVEALLKVDGWAGRDVAVTLTRGTGTADDPPLQLRQTIRVADGGRETPTARVLVRFQVPLERPGTTPITVKVGPAGQASTPIPDSRPDNDVQAVSVRVSPEQARVLLIDGEPRWEFRYLRNALARDPRVRVEAVVFHQPDIGVKPDSAVGSVGEPGDSGGFAFRTGLAQPSPGEGEGEDDPLSQYDAVVLGDVAPDDVAPGFWKRLERFVAERGGTLIVSPGPGHWSDLFGGRGRDLDGGETRRALLPVTGIRPMEIDPRAADPARPSLPPGFRLEPTPAAADGAMAWPMLQLEDRQVWDSLPRIPWALAGRPKPGAAVLATAAAARADGEDPPQAVMAAHPYGLGKVFWVGTDGTWRWRYRAGDRHHHRFWGQLIRWAAGSSKLTAGNARVRFGPIPSRIQAGETVRIRARVSEETTGMPAEPILAARLLPATGPAGHPPGSILVPLRPLPGQSRVFEGEATVADPGTYRIGLEAPGLAQVFAMEQQGADHPEFEARLEVIPPRTSERIDLAATRTDLDRLAAATGGEVFTEPGADRIPESLRRHARTFPILRDRRQTLWDRPAAMLALLAVLTLEWLARRRLGRP